MNKLLLSMIISLISFLGIQQAEAQQAKRTNPLLGKWVKVSESIKTEDANVIREDIMGYTYDHTTYQFLANGKGLSMEMIDPEEESYMERPIVWKVVGNKITVTDVENEDTFYNNYEFSIQGNSMIIKNNTKEGDDIVVYQYKFKKIK